MILLPFRFEVVWRFELPEPFHRLPLCLYCLNRVQKSSIWTCQTGTCLD